MLRPSLIMLLMRTGVFRLIMKLLMDRRVPIRAKLVIPAAIIYIISPFDLVPDIVPISGWIDDILVTLLAAAMFLSMTPRDVLMEHLGRSEARKSRKGKVIDGEYRVLPDDAGDPDDGSDENSKDGNSKAA
ncbi:MAG: DUF1232 domain-containing protein [Chloroflexi bacterium]|nr:DUF1232 domain-containing protein [Chloroflexota bacterium]MCH8869039.1 DUF1232 domain-containing protein [Chloroflexota bacterium]MCI0771699.1 DUF1232 domain-containing protein [Chloroflexota bacterium]